MERRKAAATMSAVLAAVFYALNMPFSKLLLEKVPSTMMAGLLYLGAGLGVGVMFLSSRRVRPEERLSRADLPFTVGMVALDIAAPILLMVGLRLTSSANASLLNNFEIVATAVIALALFRESISRRLWLAIALVTLSSVILSFEDLSSLQFSRGSIFVLMAAACWGLENNCTRRISGKNTFEIVTIKGLFSGLGSLVIGFCAGEKLPALKWILPTLLLGFVAYGLSIFFYIRAQKHLGAAKTSAYYAIAPFAGTFLSFVILREPFSAQFVAALVIMLLGSALATMDTMK